MLKYQIIETKRAGQTQHVGRVKLAACLDQNQLLDRMVDKNTSLRRETLAAALMLLKTTVADLCRDGNAVRPDGFVRFSPTLKGTFHDRGDQFDRQRHTVTVTAGMAKSFQAQMKKKLSMHRVAGADHGPVVNTVEDHDSGSRNQSVTSGQIVSLRGQRLKFAPGNPQESLIFQETGPGSRKISIPKAVLVSSKEIYFVMPPVPFDQGIFVLTNTLGAGRAWTGMSLPVRVTQNL